MAETRVRGSRLETRRVWRDGRSQADRFALGREAPRSPVAAQPAVAGNLGQEEDAQALQRPHHVPAEDALVQPQRDVAPARAPESRSTSSAIHSSAPSAVWALSPGRRVSQD